MASPMTDEYMKEIIAYNKRNNTSTYFYTNEFGVEKMIAIDDNPNEDNEYGCYVMNIETGDHCGAGAMTEDKMNEFFSHYNISRN